MSCLSSSEVIADSQMWMFHFKMVTIRLISFDWQLQNNVAFTVTVNSEPSRMEKSPGKKATYTHLCKECVATIIFAIHKLFVILIQCAKASNTFKFSKDGKRMFFWNSLINVLRFPFLKSKQTNKQTPLNLHILQAPNIATTFFLFLSLKKSNNNLYALAVRFKTARLHVDVGIPVTWSLIFVFTGVLLHCTLCNPQLKPASLSRPISGHGGSRMS